MFKRLRPGVNIIKLFLPQESTRLEHLTTPKHYTRLLKIASDEHSSLFELCISDEEKGLVRLRKGAKVVKHFFFGLAPEIYLSGAHFTPKTLD